MRALVVMLALAGCAAPVPPPAPRIDCPASVPIPAPLVGTPTPAKVGALEIRVDLARGAERARGDCWRDAAMGAKR